LKDGTEKMDNPFDSEEVDYTNAAKAQLDFEGEDELEENEYDSEFE